MNNMRTQKLLKAKVPKFMHEAEGGLEFVKQRSATGTLKKQKGSSLVSG